MKKMVFILLVLSGLYYYYFYETSIKQGGEIGNKFFSTKWNSDKWDFNKENNITMVYLKEGGSSKSKNVSAKYIKFYIDYKKINGQISITSYRYNSKYDSNDGYYLPDGNVFFDKDGNYKNLKRKDDDTPLLMIHNIYGKRFYDKKIEKVVYVKGMKCLKSTFLRHGTESRKFNKLVCGYYDKIYGTRILRIEYNHNDVLRYTKWNEYNNTLPVSQPIEKLMIDAVEKIVKDLEIKNFDKEKMIKEGLYHPNEKFEITK